MLRFISESRYFSLTMTDYVDVRVRGSLKIDDKSFTFDRKNFHTPITSCNFPRVFCLDKLTWKVDLEQRPWGSLTIRSEKSSQLCCESKWIKNKSFVASRKRKFQNFSFCYQLMLSWRYLNCRKILFPPGFLWFST